jgi:hypothetical protein
MKRSRAEKARMKNGGARGTGCKAWDLNDGLADCLHPLHFFFILNDCVSKRGALLARETANALLMALGAHFPHK